MNTIQGITRHVVMCLMAAGMVVGLRAAQIKSDKSLSLYAHNIKVITQRGKVTLRGAVRSETEKETIQSKAIEVAGES